MDRTGQFCRQYDQSEEVLKAITTEELLELFDLVVFDVQLINPGREIGKTIQVVSEIVKQDYSKARHLVQRLPSLVLKGVSREVANRTKIRLEATGARVQVQSRSADYHSAEEVL